MIKKEKDSILVNHVLYKQSVTSKLLSTENKITLDQPFHNFLSGRLEKTDKQTRVHWTT